MTKKLFTTLGYPYRPSVSSSGPFTNEKGAWQFTTGGAVTINSIVFETSTGRSGPYKIAVYDDNANDPDNLIAVSSEINRGSDDWHGGNFASPVALSAATTYWLAVHAGNNFQAIRTNLSGSRRYRENSDTYADGIADPFGTPATSIDTYDGRVFAQDEFWYNREGCWWPGDTTLALSANNKLGQAVYNRQASAWTAYSAWVYIDSFPNGAKIKLGIYGDPGFDGPDSLLAETAEIVGDGTSGWFGGALDTPVSITDTQFFWVTVITDTNITLNYDSISSAEAQGYRTNADTYSDGLSDPFGASGTDTFELVCIHVSADPDAPAAPPGSAAMLLVR